MADETIRIVVNDESSKDGDDLIGQEIVSQTDTGPQLQTGGAMDGGGQEPPEPPDTPDLRRRYATRWDRLGGQKAPKCLCHCRSG